MTGPRFLVLVLILVAGTTAAVLYTNGLYDRKAEEMLRAMGHEAPQTRPTTRSASRPSTRPVLRTEETAVVRASDGTRIVSVRGNGEFFRLPNGPEEGGPVVRGTIGRKAADAMRTSPPARDALRSLTGTNLRTDAMPEKATIDIRPIDVDPTAKALPWPSRRALPDDGGTVEVPMVAGDARTFVLGLKPGVRIAQRDRQWRIERVELLAP